ncbi:MAG: SpoIID/LytB domain-containing protein [bacterium]|nr:SpoIID/LytB domain-containing protein [bacterium]
MESPIIRVGVIQTSPKIKISLLGNSYIYAGDKEVHISGDKELEVKVLQSKKPKVVYRVVTKELENIANLSDIEKYKIIQVGKKVEFSGKVISDNRKYWVCIGDFEKREIAEEAFEKINGISIIEDFIGEKGGVVKITDPKGKEIVEGNIIRIKSTHPMTIFDVLVGEGFHFEHKETQSFKEWLEFRVNNYGGLVAINELPVEDYLASVNSSESNPDSPLELLKAQTVIARGTVFATIGKHHFNDSYDLCNNDHCQNYKGLVRETTRAKEACSLTRGEVLKYGKEICDTRYAAICGGITEDYQNVWFGEKIPYLATIIDAREPNEVIKFYPATSEENARRFIDSTPDAWCNIINWKIPDYLKNVEGFRWNVSYSKDELGKIIKKKTGRDIGMLIDIVPLKRGNSGRIVLLEVKGTKSTFRIRSELSIRMALSPSCLLSSCFYVKKDEKSITLHGAGWGHGVGMCQIGGSIMAYNGMKYDEILMHYFKGTKIERIY